MLCFPSVCPQHRDLGSQTSQRLQIFAMWFLLGSRFAGMQKKIWWTHRWGSKKGVFHTKFKVWLAIYQNAGKFDGEHDGAYPRTNQTKDQDLEPGLKDLEPFFLNYGLRVLVGNAESSGIDRLHRFRNYVRIFENTQNTDLLQVRYAETPTCGF